MSLADDFATRAAEHDRAGGFPFENYRAMAAAGYLGLTAPRELGGRGANLEELCLAQEFAFIQKRPDINSRIAIGAVAYQQLRVESSADLEIWDKQPGLGERSRRQAD